MPVTPPLLPRAAAMLLASWLLVTVEGHAAVVVNGASASNPPVESGGHRLPRSSARQANPVEVLLVEPICPAPLGSLWNLPALPWRPLVRPVRLVRWRHAFHRTTQHHVQ